MLDNMHNILIVVAHPDDEVLGCGGLIKKLNDLGKYVAILYLNNGCNVRENNAEISEVRKQIHAVNKIINPFGNIFVKDYQTAEFEKYPQNTFNDEVSSYVHSHFIDTIITHADTDLHKDHRVVHEAVMVAGRFKPNSPVKNILTFPVISSSDISPKWKFTPNFYVGLTDEDMEAKVTAMTKYETEYQIMEKHRGEDAIQTWGRFFGLQSNHKYAEAYQIIRSVY